MRTKLAEYQNGNVKVVRFSDGTVIRYSEDDEFNFAFPENMDVKICDRCDMGCPYCHEGSTVDGELGDIMNAAWVDTLHPFTECAIGGGNVFEHPDFLPFLRKLKNRQVFANVTVNQTHFLQNSSLLKKLVDEKLIWGIGVSLTNPTAELFEVLKRFPNAVLHVIAGVLNDGSLRRLMEHGKDLKILILGYKKIRRGEKYYKQDLEDYIETRLGQTVDWRIGMLERCMPLMFEAFKVVSFDCLAIEQLHVKKHLPPQVWDRFFQGEDGTMTFYIDMVQNQFAESSTAPLDERQKTLDSVDEMFSVIKEAHKNREDNTRSN